MTTVQLNREELAAVLAALQVLQSYVAYDPMPEREAVKEAMRDECGYSLHHSDLAELRQKVTGGCRPKVLVHILYGSHSGTSANTLDVDVEIMDWDNFRADADGDSVDDLVADKMTELAKEYPVVLA